MLYGVFVLYYGQDSLQVIEIQCPLALVCATHSKHALSLSGACLGPSN